MNQLKFALGKEQKEQKSISRVRSSTKNANKSKSNSIWALDPDITGEGDQQNQQYLTAKKAGQILQSSLKSAFMKDKLFSEIIFNQTIQKIQVSLQQDLDEINTLLLLQKKIKQIIDTSTQQTKNFNVSFYEMLVKRIKKLKKKQKKQDLNQYDKIIHNNFKKRSQVEYINQQSNNLQQYLQIKDIKMNKIKSSNNLISKDEESLSKKSNTSNEGKLKGLLSQEKFVTTKKVSGQDNYEKNNQSAMGKNQSVSFTAVISQSMTVRQRAPRGAIGLKKEKPKQEISNNQRLRNGKQDEDKDQAFIFYRPKKGKKTG